jgi:hypothetical protein
MAMESVEGRPDGTLRPRLVIGTLDARGMVRLCTDHCSRQNTTKRVSAQSRHASEYLVRQVSYWRKAPATKHYVSPLRLRGSSSLHEYLFSNSKRVNIGFLSFFSFHLLLALFLYF